MSECTSCGGSGEVGTFDETGEIAGIAGCLDCGQTGQARPATPPAAQHKGSMMGKPEEEAPAAGALPEKRYATEAMCVDCSAFVGVDDTRAHAAATGHREFIPANGEFRPTGRATPTPKGEATRVVALEWEPTFCGVNEVRADPRERVSLTADEGGATVLYVRIDVDGPGAKAECERIYRAAEGQSTRVGRACAEALDAAWADTPAAAAALADARKMGWLPPAK